MRYRPDADVTIREERVWILEETPLIRASLGELFRVHIYVFIKNQAKYEIMNILLTFDCG